MCGQPAETAQEPSGHFISVWRGTGLTSLNFHVKTCLFVVVAVVLFTNVFWYWGSGGGGRGGVVVVLSLGFSSTDDSHSVANDPRVACHRACCIIYCTLKASFS